MVTLFVQKLLKTSPLGETLPGTQLILESYQLRKFELVLFRSVFMVVFGCLRSIDLARLELFDAVMGKDRKKHNAEWERYVNIVLIRQLNPAISNSQGKRKIVRNTK